MRSNNSCWFSEWRLFCPYHCYHCRFNDHDASAIGRTHCVRSFNGKISNGMKSTSNAKNDTFSKLQLKPISATQFSNQRNNETETVSILIQRTFNDTHVTAMEIYFRIIGCSLFFGVDPEFTSAEYDQIFSGMVKLVHLIWVGGSEQSMRAFMWRICYLFHTHTNVANWITIQSSVRYLFVHIWKSKESNTKWHSVILSCNRPHEMESENLSIGMSTYHWKHSLCSFVAGQSVVRVRSFVCCWPSTRDVRPANSFQFRMRAFDVGEIDIPHRLLQIFFSAKIAIFKCYGEWWYSLIKFHSPTCYLRFFPSSKKFQFFFYLKKNYHFWVALRKI